MKSQFSNINLSELRYSLVWESGENMSRFLNISQEDHLMVISSAGCNVLNALLANPQSITAIDLNENQNMFLKIKMHIFKHHTYELLMSFLGFKNHFSKKEVLIRLRTTLSSDEYAWLAQFFNHIENDAVDAGRLEKYIQSFYKYLSLELQHKIKELLQCDRIEEQHDFFITQLDQTEFKELFIDYFDAKELSKGRDPKLFKYAEKSSGSIFYSRLLESSKRVLFKENFYIQFFMLGSQGVEHSLLPSCYQEQHFNVIAQRLHKVKLVTGEAMSYLGSPEGEKINKASLSNIFEYVSTSEFELAIKKLNDTRINSVRIVFWNLLQNHQLKAKDHGRISNEVEQELYRFKPSCFYFRNIQSATLGYSTASFSDSLKSHL